MAVNATGPVKNFGAFTVAALAQMAALFGSSYNTYAAGVVAGTIPRNVLTGSLDVFLVSSATTPGAQTTPTAAQLWADAIAQFGLAPGDPALANGLQYTLTITQIGGGTFTLTAGTGVTLVGATQTVTANTTRQWIVNLTPTTATFTSVATGTYS